MDEKRRRINDLCVTAAKGNVDISIDTLAGDYDVAVAMDGESALGAFGSGAPDIILLDMMMPGMDGFEDGH